MSESAFLAVDNNPEDLAVLASALRSRYAAEYDIYTASSGTEARATLAMLSQAGKTVALLIVSRENTRSGAPLPLAAGSRIFSKCQKGREASRSPVSNGSPRLACSTAL